MKFKKFLTSSILILGSFVVHSQTNPVKSELDSIIQDKTFDKKLTDSLSFKIDENTPLTNYKFKSKFKKEYIDGAEFHYNEEENNSLGAKLKRIWNEIKSWLIRNLIPSSSDLNSLSIFVKIGFWLLIIIFLFLIIKSIVNRDITWIFTRKKKTIKTAFDIIEKDIKSIEFEELLAKTIQTKDYRLAIRYYYLWLLQTLSKQQYINWELEKTNADYLNEIKDLDLKKEFKYLSYLYNNVWYGEFPLEIEVFNSASASFVQTLNKLNK